ncbi:hypothetical protein ScPMuIL_011044 [Solemya velum]
MLSFLSPPVSSCTFPVDLTGEWYSSGYGILNFTGNAFAGHQSNLHTNPLTFTCYTTSGSNYVSYRRLDVLENTVVDLYICWDLTKVTSDSYYFYNRAGVERSSGERVHAVKQNEVVAVGDVCTEKSTVGTYEFFVSKSSSAKFATTCPDALQSVFDVTIYSANGQACNGTVLTGSSTKTSLSFNYSSCATGALFSNSGHFWCLYHMTEGSFEYITLFNDDVTVDDGSSTFKFVCIVYTKSGAVVRATVLPESCDSAQTDRTVISPGMVLVLEDRLELINPFVTPVENDDTGLIVGVTVAVIVCICVIVILAVFIWKIGKKKRRLDFIPPEGDSIVTINGAVRARPLSTTFKHLADEISAARRDHIELSSPSVKETEVVLTRPVLEKNGKRKSSILITVSPVEEVKDEPKKKKKKKKKRKARVPLETIVLPDLNSINEQVIRLQEGRPKSVRFEESNPILECPRWQFMWERNMSSPRRKPPPMTTTKTTIPTTHRDKPTSSRSTTIMEPRLSPTPEVSIEEIPLPGTVKVEPTTPWILPQKNKDDVFVVVAKLWPKIWTSSTISSAYMNDK